MDDNTAPTVTEGGALRTRDDQGLTLEQKRLLTELIEETNWRVACKNANVPERHFKHMLQHDKAFREAYKHLYTPVLDIARAHLTNLLPAAADVLEEGMAANEAKTVEVACPECGHQFEVAIQDPNWNVRLRAVENIHKATGEIVQRHVVEGEITHRDVTLEDLLGRAILARGGEVPPQVVERLRAHGLLGDAPPLEGEYTVQSPEPPDTPDEST